jgi:hypothetical protein
MQQRSTAVLMPSSEDITSLARFTGALLLLPSSLLGIFAALLWSFRAANGGIEPLALFLSTVALLGTAAGVGLLRRRKWAALILMVLMDIPAIACFELAVTSAPSALGVLVGLGLAVGFLTTSAVGALAWRALRW